MGSFQAHGNVVDILVFHNVQLSSYGLASMGRGVLSLRSGRLTTTDLAHPRTIIQVLYIPVLQGGQSFLSRAQDRRRSFDRSSREHRQALSASLCLLMCLKFKCVSVRCILSYRIERVEASTDLPIISCKDWYDVRVQALILSIDSSI